MADVKKVPYYKPQKGLFGSELREYKGARGCIPLDTQSSVSIDRLAPGEKPPPPPPRPMSKPSIAPKTSASPQPPPPADQAITEASPTQAESEVCKNPPPFDLQDVPIAMDNLGWKVSAKLARIWFASAAHIYNNDPISVQPLNLNDVTLDWTLKFGNVKRKFSNLITHDIYREAAIDLARKKIFNRARNLFLEKRGANLSFSTGQFINDILQFHINWQFQYAPISDWDTLENLTPTDLTGALANFNIYIAIGNVEISGEKYFRYEKTSNFYCADTVAKITHVYAYIKDNYSFNDSQYLGHWNKRGVIIAPGSLLARSSAPKRDSDIDIWVKSIKKPVDTRKSLLGKFKKSDVYFPIYNADYSRWREKHHQGRDFMVYSKPVHLKLKKPIEFKLGEICRLDSPDTLA
ncbi:hypothetical protein BLA18112_06952 [Burkholderia lata]|uniref:Uncharacterized protein n=1 Tax=Burkholderia lata (strain ATCC 17760 / DSM 23089 / LMG 22485 / NCIMB 9086 / R18194 / 383) TaxID=482957 RepID=A0A6P3A840_BURL3|nr:DUF6402 family protein [Burkholderia lata]VWD43467.1 hypothetical protein BLA18112_06952 [Burkholderia lata]